MAHPGGAVVCKWFSGSLDETSLKQLTITLVR